MNREHMDGLIFSREEFLVLMDSLKPPALIGFATEDFVPASQEEHQAMIRDGIQRLIERGLLEIRDDVNVFQPELALMARVLAYPDLVFLLLRDDPGLGSRRFNYYQANQFIVEFTQPTDETFRLAGVPNTVALLNRMAYILPVSQPAAALHYDAVLSKENFFGARELVSIGDEEGAMGLLAQSILPVAAKALVTAMVAPAFSGTVAYLRVIESTAVDGYNLAVVQGNETAWLMAPINAEAESFQVTTCLDSEFQDRLFRELIQFVNPTAKTLV